MIFTAVGMGAANAGVNAAMAVRQARETSASQTLAHQLRQAVDSAHRWFEIACAQAAEIETLNAENARLKRIARDQHNDLVALSRRA